MYVVTTQEVIGPYPLKNNKTYMVANTLQSLTRTQPLAQPLRSWLCFSIVNWGQWRQLCEAVVTIRFVHTWQGLRMLPGTEVNFFSYKHLCTTVNTQMNTGWGVTAKIPDIKHWIGGGGVQGSWRSSSAWLCHIWGQQLTELSKVPLITGSVIVLGIIKKKTLLLTLLAVGRFVILCKPEHGEKGISELKKLKHETPGKWAMTSDGRRVCSQAAMLSARLVYRLLKLEAQSLDRNSQALEFIFFLVG